MFWQLIISGFLLGAVSSFHCVGMCGPIALSLPVHFLAPKQKAPGIFLYNSGRVTMYALLGLLFGFVGRQVYLGGFQKGFSIVLGSLLLVILLQSLLSKKWLTDRWLQKPTARLQQVIRQFMRQKNVYGLFLLGAANGLLPCGMVYIAVTGAMAAGSITGGVVFMAAFGAGTFPAMFALSFFGSMIGLRARNTMKKAVPFVMLAMGILLILRGLSLNIPYISPSIPGSSGTAVSCH